MLLIGVVFCALWITGLATSYTMGGFIHVLLILGITAFLSRMIRANNSSRVAKLRASAPPAGTWGREK